MDVEQIKVGFADVFCYIISCDSSNESVIIDPAGDEDRIVDRINQKELNLKYIINTHGHHDHTCGNGRIKELTGAEIIMHEEDDRLFNSPKGQKMAEMYGFALSPHADVFVKHDDEIAFGNEKLKVIHTPGHSPGGICLLGDGNLFSGDTLFVGAVGRTDLPGASYSVFMDSIKERLLSLPDDTIVWPGHDYGDRPSSTIGREKETNPWLN